MTRHTWDLLARLAIPTVLMAAAGLYWASLLDARMRDQNLILIQPVVIFLLGCYVLVIGWEIRRHLRLAKDLPPAGQGGGDIAKQIALIVIAIAGAALFRLLGAIPATLFVLVAGMLALGVRRPLVILLVSALTTSLLWLVFIKAFGMRMPLFIVP